MESAKLAKLKHVPCVTLSRDDVTNANLVCTLTVLVLASLAELLAKSVQRWTPAPSVLNRSIVWSARQMANVYVMHSVAGTLKATESPGNASARRLS